MNSIPLRVLTLNIWGQQGPWPERLELIRRELQELHPDVVGLQEVTRHTDRQIDQAHEIARGLGYHVAFGAAFTMPDGTMLGNAVLSRFPLRSTTNIPLPATGDAEPRAAVHADIAAPFGRLPFFVTHLEWRPENSRLRVQQVTAMLDAVNGLSSGHGAFPAVLVGDFNADPDSGEVRRLSEATGRDGARFTDCFAAAGDGSTGCTFARSNDYAAGDCDRDQRIDYIFSRGPDRAGRGLPLTARLVCTAPDAGVFASDHYGVYAELQTAGRPIPFPAGMSSR